MSPVYKDYYKKYEKQEGYQIKTKEERKWATGRSDNRIDRIRKRWIERRDEKLIERLDERLEE